MGVVRLRRKVHRGPRRIVPREEVGEVLRRRANGEKPDAIARAMQISKRTVYRYLAEPEPSGARRIRDAVESWPDADALTPEQREELVGWLHDALAGWHA